MQMTEAEIVKSYQTAARQTQQIKVLAELNLCEKKDIREILEKHGCSVPHYGNRYTKTPKTTKNGKNEQNKVEKTTSSPVSVINAVKLRMSALNDQIKPLETRLEELATEYNALNDWLKAQK